MTEQAPKLHALGPAVQVIADKYIETLTPFEVAVLYAAAAKLLDMEAVLIDPAHAG